MAIIREYLIKIDVVDSKYHNVPKIYMKNGETGVDFLITITSNGTVLDISSATTMTLNVKHSDNTTTTISGTFESDGTDGVIRFPFTGADNTIDGTSTVEVIISDASNEIGTETFQFKIESKIV